MRKEKGNILIVVVLLAIVGIVLFSMASRFFGEEPKESEAEPENSLSQPVFKQETTASPPEEKPKEETRELDSSPPVLSNPQPVGGLSYQTRETYLSLETNEKAACRYSDVSGVYYEYMQGKFSTEDGFFHQASITTLSASDSRAYYVRCMDEEGNANMQDLIISFWVEEPEDFVPPQRTNFYPTGDVLPAGTKNTIIGVSTDEPASCRYDTQAGADYDSMDYRFSADKYERYHTTTITNLADGQAYGFYVRCKDLKGNKNTGDVLIHFQVGL